MLFNHVYEDFINTFLEEGLDDFVLNIPEFDYSEAVTEAYYGKTSELKMCEQLLGTLKEKLNQGLVDVNQSKEAKKIESLLSKTFSIYSLRLVFTHENLFVGNIDIKNTKSIEDIPIHVMGAYTIPFRGGFFDKDKKTGFSDLSNAGMVVTIPTVYFMDMDLTPGEVLAIILHEIGHSLNSSIMNLIATIPLISLKNMSKAEKTGFLIGVGNSIVMQSIPQLSSFISRFMGYFNKASADILYKIPLLRELSKFVNSLVELKDIILLFKKLKKLFGPMFLQNLLFSVLNPANLFGYGVEAYSDSVATAYGYGPELSVALTKLSVKPNTSLMNKAVKGASKNMATGIALAGFGNFMYLYKEVLTMYFKPHPMTATRVLNQIKKCRRELANPNITPDMRKALNNDLKMMEEFVDNELLDYKKNLKRGTISQYLVNFVVIKILKGFVDVREILQLVYRNEA